jgi:tripartite-type tricarboxylate transporter receptor subunit TctC
MTRAHAALAVILLACTACAKPAEDRFPSRPIELVIAFPPGGATDLAGRVFADGLSKVLKVPVIATNRGGGSGVLGATVVLQARKDGYTLLANSISGMVLGPAVMKDVSFAADRDFAPIALIMTAPNSLIVSPNSPFKTLEDLMAAAKQRPGLLTYATAGTGSDGHFNAAVFLRGAGLDVKHVPFTGGGELATAVMGGHVDFGVGSLTSYFSLAVAGKLRNLAITGRQRMKVFPDVPTFEERGVTGDFVNGWAGSFVPVGTPPAIIELLVARASDVVQSPEFKQKIEKLGAETSSISPPEFLAMIREQRRAAAAIAADIGMVLPVH